MAGGRWLLNTGRAGEWFSRFVMGVGVKMGVSDAYSIYLTAMWLPPKSPEGSHP